MYDLEDKINLIYEYLYNSNTKNCFSFDKISLGKIGLEDIKIPIITYNDENKEELTLYEDVKKEIFNGRFKLLNFDEDIYQLLFKVYSNQFPVNVKVSFYNYNENIDSFDSQINNDSLFSYLLSELILANKTRHILLPIINVDVKLADIEKLIKEDNCYNIIKNGIMNNIISDTCCLQLREHFFKTITLEEYYKQNTNICSYKALLFQVIHTFATIQKEHEGFRHNNLKLKNILVYLRKNPSIIVEYNGFKNDTFYLRDFEFDIKITNFENSVIPKFYGLKNLKNKNIKFADQANPYYDMYVFLNDLLTQIKFSKTECNDKTKEFLEKVIPTDIRGKDKFNKNIVIAQPIDLLYDKYFEEYRNKPSKNVSSDDSIVNHPYLTGIDTFLESDNYSILGKQDKLISKSNIMIKQNRRIKPDLTETELIREEFQIQSGGTQNIRTIKHEDIREQIGGDEKPTITPYRAEKNNPFLSNEQREVNKKVSAENPTREPPVILEQKIYDTSKPAQTKPQFPPTFIPLYDQQGDVMNHMMPYSRVINQPPVQKVYNVSLSNPIGNYTSLNRIYEDVLPGNPFSYTALTVYERKQLIDFLRNSIIENNDGEEMTVTGGKNSLLSYIKVLDINPYITKQNPYENLPKNFLLYRAGYPIRFDEKNKLINMGKPSMGINVRIYMMSIGDLRCKTIGKNINADDFDLWRDIKYYDWVREELIKGKISPNFIAPILYKIDSGSKIDWVKVDTLKYKGYTSDTLKQLKDNQQKINMKHKLQKSVGLFDGLLPMQFRKQIEREVKNELGIKPNPKEPSKCEAPLSVYMNTTPCKCNCVKNQPYNRTNCVCSCHKIVLEEKEDITMNSGKVLILLTEAPTTNIIQWSSTLYESFGSQKKMISTGYHTPEVWVSLLFQLVYTFSILQERGIYMQNVSLENNIYIKDIFSDPNSIGSWIYKVDSVDYYIPNYGYILMFDSKYADIPISEKFVKIDNKEQDYKIYGKIYEKNSVMNMGNINSIIYAQFKSLIDPDNFRHNLKVKGGSIPDDSVLDLLKKMHDNNDSMIIRNLIPKFFNNYVHNRVGTLLTQTEKANINMLSKPNYMKGNLIILQRRSQEYEWVIYLGLDETNPRMRKIITNKDGNHMIESVFSNFLFGYPDNEKVNPETKRNMKYDETHIYETYNLDNLKN